MASEKGAIKKDALYDFESILVSALVSKDDMRKPLGAASPAAQLLSAGSGCHNGL